MTIGLVGYGRFGRLVARYLSRYASVLVYDNRPAVLAARRGRVWRASLPKVASQSVVVLAVPMSALRLTLRSIRRYVRPGALVIDVCTLKMKPIQWMRASLPSSVNILGMHPLFGPDSDRGTLRGQRIVLCPARIPRPLLLRVRRLLRARGLKVTLMTPAQHDRMIAETIMLTHYVGRFVHYAGIPRWRHITPSYVNLLSVVDVATNDSLQLLRDIWQYNPYSRVLAAALRSSRHRLELVLK